MIVELILLLVLLYFVLSYYRKGLMMALCSLLILVLSSLGAMAAQELFAPKMADWLMPRITSSVEESLSEKVSETTNETMDNVSQISFKVAGTEMSIGDLIEFLNAFGIDVEASVESTADRASEPVISRIADGVAAAVADMISRMVVFLAAFLVISLVLHSVALAVNVVDRLPVIHTLNHLGGGVVGFIGGSFLLTMLMALLVSVGLAGEDAFHGPISGLIRSVAAKLI